MIRLRSMAFLLSGAMAAGAMAQDDLERGHSIVAEHCGRCHAVDVEGASPLNLAPPFRTLGERYPISDLEEALAEGILTGHPEMPQLSFEPGDIAAVIAYIQSLQKS